VVVVDDPSDEVVVVRVPPSDVRVVVVDVVVGVCARAGTIPITVPISRAVSNFMRLSKLHGEWQVRLPHGQVDRWFSIPFGFLLNLTALRSAPEMPDHFRRGPFGTGDCQTCSRTGIRDGMEKEGITPGVGRRLEPFAIIYAYRISYPDFIQ
jgi:hypothetical protein